MPASLRKKKYERLVGDILGIDKEQKSKSIKPTVPDRIEHLKDDNRVNKKKPEYDTDFRKS